MHDLNGMDMVPEPAIVAAALRACRRINDYSLTTRILEVYKIKACASPQVWAYCLQVGGSLPLLACLLARSIAHVLRVLFKLLL